jgi:hypothetical protein
MYIFIIFDILTFDIQTLCPDPGSMSLACHLRPNPGAASLGIEPFPVLT